MLEARGVGHPHIQKIVHAALTRLAEDRGIPANRFLYSNGIVQALASKKAKEPLPIDKRYTEDADVPAELLGRAELYALYDAFFALHERKVPFEAPEGERSYLAFRYKAKSDAYYLGHLLGFDGFSDCHKRWAHEFFPRWNPTGLPRNYTLKQRNDWLASQSEVKDFLLMASRRAYKSTFARVFICGLLATCPDATVYIIAETRPLAKANIEAIRGFFEVEQGVDGPYVHFQRLFPDACIPKDSGSVAAFEHPLRRLRLPNSVESGSMDGSTVGRRSQVIFGDDIISEESCGNEEQTQKQIKKWGMVRKLREKGGVVINCATPYSLDPPDVYADMIATRVTKYQDPSFAHRIEPAFTLKPQSRWKLTTALLPSITEFDVESFLMPEGLPWSELQVDMRTSPSTFMSQNLCIFPKPEDADIKVQFDHDDIQAVIRPMSFFGAFPIGARNICLVDRSSSQSRFADFSVFLNVRLQRVQDKEALVVTAGEMMRDRDSVVADRLASFIAKNNSSIVTMESDRSWEDFRDSVKKNLMQKHPLVAVPFFRIIPISNAPQAKARKIKRLELPIAEKRIWFNHGIPELDAMLLQLERYDGSRSTAVSKDDFPDALALGIELLPRTQQDPKEEPTTPERERLKEAEAARQMREAHNRRMFGGASVPKPPEPAPEPTPQPRTSFPRGGNWASLPGPFRGGPKR